MRQHGRRVRARHASYCWSRLPMERPNDVIAHHLRVEQDLQRKAETAQLLLDAARYLGETLEPERVYRRFEELLADVIPNDGVVVSSFDEREGLIRCEYASVEGNRIDPATLPELKVAATGGMQSEVIRTGRSLLANDVGDRVSSGDGTFYDVDRAGTVRKVPDTGPTTAQAAMMVPVKHENRVVGVVQVMSDRQAYTDEDLELMEGLVAQMGAAVRTAHLHEDRRQAEAAEAAALATAAQREQSARESSGSRSSPFGLSAVSSTRSATRPPSTSSRTPRATSSRRSRTSYELR